MRSKVAALDLSFNRIRCNSWEETEPVLDQLLGDGVVQYLDLSNNYLLALETWKQNRRMSEKFKKIGNRLSLLGFDSNPFTGNSDIDFWLRNARAFKQQAYGCRYTEDWQLSKSSFHLQLKRCFYHCGAFCSNTHQSDIWSVPLAKACEVSRQPRLSLKNVTAKRVVAKFRPQGHTCRAVLCRWPSLVMLHATDKPFGFPSKSWQNHRVPLYHCIFVAGSSSASYYFPLFHL